MNNLYYVYQLQLKNPENLIYYIGLTQDPKGRQSSHKTYTNSICAEYYSDRINKYGFDMKILHQLKSYGEARDCEIYYINNHGTILNKNGNLANMLC